MTLQKAISIIGARPIWEIRNMHKALSFHSWMNSYVENERKEAASVILASGGLYRRMISGMNSREVAKDFPREARTETPQEREELIKAIWGDE